MLIDYRLVCEKLTIFPHAECMLNSVKDWLSYDIVKFKIELGVEEKFKCKYATKQTQHGDTPVQRIAMAKQSYCSSAAIAYTCIRTHTPSPEWRQHARAVRSQ